MAALPALRVPGVADLDAVSRGDDVVIAGTADDLAGGEFAYDPWEHVAVFLSLQRGIDVLPGLCGLWHRGVPQLPQLAVGFGGGESLTMTLVERLQANAVALERNGL